MARNTKYNPAFRAAVQSALAACKDLPVSMKLAAIGREAGRAQVSGMSSTPFMVACRSAGFRPFGEPYNLLGMMVQGFKHSSGCLFTANI